ncbi:type VI secretion system-associated FHA domain protein TagH [Oxalobacteraceae bacterium]|nr:type VI secretion system-associated FHA domain protein TagH [Oxalobacteraceae bacterium]
MDLGSNPSWINDRPVGTGKTANLEHGDRLLIGDYVLEVEVEQGAPSYAVPVFQPEYSPELPFQAQPEQPRAPESGPGFEELRDTLAGVKILDMTGGFDAFAPPSPDDPLGLKMLHQDASNDSAPVPGQAPVPAFRGSESDHAAPQFIPMPGARVPVSAPVEAPPAPAPQMLIPDDYDPLADFLPPRVHAPQPAAQTGQWPGAQAQAPWQGGGFNAQAPQGWPPTGASMPAPAPMQGLWQAGPPATAPADVNMVAAPPSSTPAAPAAAAQASEHAVLLALLRGLGLPDVVPTRSPTETAELAGAMLREATSGTMAVLLARAMTKRESRLEMTVLGAQANNPLKFFPDAESALAQMLTNAMSGYMPPVKSFGSAFEDLKAHELAVIAGMRAALAGVLARFDPAQIEAKMEPAGVMDKMLATNRKARMWDRMVALYDDILRESDDDFQHLFGERFSAAYEDQIGRLHQR